MEYKSVDQMPFNVCPKSEWAWNNFIDATLSGNAYSAIQSYHEYRLAKEKVLKTQNLKQEDFSM